MKCFTVNSKDLFDPQKNPHLSLSAKDIAKNPKIPKRYRFCPKCGQAWIVHDGDGSCVKD